jgi:PhnB protein
MSTPTNSTPVSPVPPGYHTITPAITVHDAAAAIAFYQQAFGAEEISRLTTPDGEKILHAEVQIGNARLMLSDEFPEMSTSASPRTLSGTTGSLLLYVEDAEAVFARAVAAGATVGMPLALQFWGDRCGRVIDPFGHSWSIASRVEEVSQAEIQRRAQAFSEQSA